MKKITIAILVFALLALVSCASTGSGEVDFNALYEGTQKVIEVEGASQDDLFVKANNWAVSAFANSDSVIEFTDKESGTITGKYYMRYTGSSFYLWPSGQVAPWTLIQINVKDGKARISLKLSSIDYYSSKGIKFTSSSDAYFAESDAETLTARWESLIADFEKALKAEAVEW